MSSTRIAPVSAPLSESLASQMAILMPPGMPPPKLFLSVARNSKLFDFMVASKLIGPTGLMDRRTLPKDVRETIILVQTISERMGLSMEQIEDLKLDVVSPTLWREDLCLLTRIVDSMVKVFKLQDDLYEEAKHHFSEEELIDITQLVGLYTGVAMMVGLIRPELDRYRSGQVFTTKV
jgi:4-carboxymuconolactone decarboxylase